MIFRPCSLRNNCFSVSNLELLFMNKFTKNVTDETGGSSPKGRRFALRGSESFQEELDRGPDQECSERQISGLLRGGSPRDPPDEALSSCHDVGDRDLRRDEDASLLVPEGAQGGAGGVPLGHENRRPSLATSQLS